MAKLAIKPGSTSQSVYLFIRDTSVTTGAGLTGLVYNTGSLVAYYCRVGAAATSISLVTQTATGAYSSGGFVEVSSANMPGLYRLDLPDAVCATGVRSAVVMLKGATNMETCVLEIDLKNDANVVYVAGTLQYAPATGTAQTGTSSSMTLAASAEAWVGMRCRIISGSGAWTNGDRTTVKIGAVTGSGTATPIIYPVGNVWPYGSPSNTSAYELYSDDSLAPIVGPTSGAGLLQVDLQSVLGQQQVGTGIVGDNYRPTGAPVG